MSEQKNRSRSANRKPKKAEPQKNTTCYQMLSRCLPVSAVGILIGFGIESQSPCVIDLSMLWYLDQPPLVCCLKSDGNGSQNSVGDQYRRNPVSIHYWFPVPDHQGFQCQISCGSYSQTLWFPIALLVVIESQNRIPLTKHQSPFFPKFPNAYLREPERRRCVGRSLMSRASHIGTPVRSEAPSLKRRPRRGASALASA